MCVTVTAIRTSQEKDPSDSIGLPTASSIQPRMRGDGRFHPLEGHSWFKGRRWGRARQTCPEKARMSVVWWIQWNGPTRVQAVSLTTNQKRGKHLQEKKTEQTEWKEKWHESTMFNKQLFLVVEGAPFPRIPVTGRESFLHRGTYLYVTGCLCVCDSYTVIILDG